MSRRLDGRTVVVVGASAGIGRAFARQAAAAGGHVVAVARRGERLEELAASGGSWTTVAADVSRPEGITRVTEAVVAAGAVDLVVFAAGSSPLRRAEDTAPPDWDAVFHLNVVAFNEVARLTLPHLAPGGLLAVLSSETVDQPRQGLMAYAASKSALEASLRSWRLEHPGRRFTCIRVGATHPTEFGDAFDVGLLGDVLGQWVSHGLMQEDFMDTEHVATVLLETLGVLLEHPGVGLEDVVLRSPSAVVAQHPLTHGTTRDPQTPEG